MDDLLYKNLEEVGEKYSLKSEYLLFANYCFLKHKGLRKEAIKSLNEFIVATEQKNLENQREIAVELATLGYTAGNSDIISHPLKEYLNSIFAPWSNEENPQASTFRWLGYINGDYSNFEKAFEIDPTDQISISKLAQSHLDDVEYQTHHLGESFLLGDIDTAKLSLQNAVTLMAKLKSEIQRSEISHELHYLQNVVNAWEEYNLGQKTDSFPDWCKLNRACK